MGRTIGYAFVSGDRNAVGKAELELRAAGAVQVFVDTPGRRESAGRPNWSACLDSLRSGDTLVIVSLVALGTQRLAIDTVTSLGQRSVNIRSLAEPIIDSTKPTGRSLFEIVGVLAQLRITTIRDNTQRGLERARLEGRVGGRPSVMSSARIAEARRMRAGGASIARVAKVLGVGASSVSRALQRAEAEVRPRGDHETRVFFRDTKPYELPAALDELTGPAGGTLVLPHSIHWGPQRSVDLGTMHGIRKAYQAVLREGTAEDQTALLNREILEREWAELTLPDRVRVLWETRFPELRRPVSA